MSDKNTQTEINLDNLGTNDTLEAQESAIGKLNSNVKGFGDNLRYSWNTISRKTNIDYSKRKSLFIFLMILVAIVWILFFKYDKYIIDYSNWIENTDNKVSNMYEKAKKKVYNLIGLEYDEEIKTIKLDGDDWITILNNLIKSDKSYIFKKETLKPSITNLIFSIIDSVHHLDETKKHVSTYGFFSDKLSNIISDDEAISSIKDSLSAIESIKFSSAISVFSKLDTFIERLSKETWLTKDQIMTNIDNITQRWEKDINLYIKNCYLNASEIDYNCNNIWDFNKYYELTEDENFNASFFKYLIQFVDNRLEQTEVPSFSIKFKSFDPNRKELTFDIEINTFKEDEIELAKKWILSPHSFILNSLINNLKLSRVIVSEPIEVKSININQRTIVFGNTEFTVNTSNKTFTVPIKKENQIEIDDFVY